MRTIFLLFLLINLQIISHGQFFPSANAVWCGIDDDGGPPGYNVQFEMSAVPDTLINSTVYKKITEYNDHSGNWMPIRNYYVRSDENGKGYVYLLDSLVEYIAGDISAQTGDTIHDVLTVLSGPNYVYYLLNDIIVDSVVVLSNAGVTVTRYYVGPNLFIPAAFWQIGMGTSCGPLLEHSGMFHLCGVNDTIQYNINNNFLPGPGGVSQICWPITTAVPEVEQDGERQLLVYPNPSSGIFTAEIPASEGSHLYRLTVQDALGRTAYTTTTKMNVNTLDLRGRTGLFLLIVEGGGSRWSTRIIIE